MSADNLLPRLNRLVRLVQQNAERKIGKGDCPGALDSILRTQQMLINFSSSAGPDRLQTPEVCKKALDLAGQMEDAKSRALNGTYQQTMRLIEQYGTYMGLLNLQIVPEMAGKPLEIKVPESEAEKRHLFENMRVYLSLLGSQNTGK